jgi:hypothetical protein
MLHAVRRTLAPDWAALPGDRGFIAAHLAIAAGLGVVEPMVMWISLFLITFTVLQPGAKGG